MTEVPGEPRTTGVLIYSMILGFSAGCSKPPVQDLHRVLTASPTVERTDPISTIPMDIQMNKLFVSATVHDQTRTFIFDTGSPTMLSQRFATELGLEIVGSNTGLDANGREVTMGVAMVDSLALGEVTFHRVPVLVFDFDQLYLGSCFFAAVSSDPNCFLEMSGESTQKASAWTSLRPARSHHRLHRR